MPSSSTLPSATSWSITVAVNTFEMLPIRNRAFAGTSSPEVPRHRAPGPSTRTSAPVMSAGRVSRVFASASRSSGPGRVVAETDAEAAAVAASGASAARAGAAAPTVTAASSAPAAVRVDQRAVRVRVFIRLLSNEGPPGRRWL